MICQILLYVRVVSVMSPAAILTSAVWAVDAAELLQ